MNIKTIRIAFVDFWDGCDIENHIISKVLRTKYNIEYVEPGNADYVFFSVFGDKHWFLPEDAIKIFYTGENLAPDFNACDYAIGFEWMDFADRYFRLPNYYATNFFLPKVGLMQKKHLLHSDFDYTNREFCSFVVSNPIGNPIRKEVFKVLSEYKKVDSGGRWMNNVGGPVEDKLLFERNHKFSICFENSSHPGYTTEKIVEAFAAQTVPIYWGDSCIAKMFNSESFLNVAEFSSLDEMKCRIVEIDNDDDLYLKMLQTPALLDVSYSYENQAAGLSDFLQHIVEQPKYSAQRYNRDFWGAKYIKNRTQLIENSKKSLKTLFYERCFKRN